jgi:hypothetical protein
MHTRSMKRRKVEGEIEEMSQNVMGIDEEREREGASCLKFEIIRKRDAKTGIEKKVLQAKRCSARHRTMGLNDFCSNPLGALEERHQQVDMSIEYNPSSFEKLFAKDQNVQKVQQLAIQKSVRLESHEIEKVVGYLDASKKLALVKLLRSHEIVKSTGMTKMAAFVGNKFEYLDLIATLEDGKYMSKFQVVQVSSEARTHIKRII